MIGRKVLGLRIGLAALLLVAATLTTAVAAPAAAASSSAWFSSPSKNIGCYMDASSVRCDVLKYTYKATKRPAWCPLAWGPAVEVDTKGKGHFECVGDTVAGSKTILKYGHSRSIGRFTCTSRTTGMTCIDRWNGHGFRVSKASYRFF